MSSLLDSTGNAVRDIDPGAVGSLRFGNLARSISTLVGRPTVFAIAVLAVVLWAASGPFFGFSDTWQLIVNTSTTIVTFLMVFLIQNTQNRDTVAMQIKLDEEELKHTLRRYEQLAAAARRRLACGRRDTGSPEVRPAR